MLRFLLTMTHEATVRRFLELFRVGTVCKPTGDPSDIRRAQKWQYQSCGVDTVAMIGVVYPYLFTKQEQGMLALEWGEKCLCPKIAPSKGERLPEEILTSRELIYNDLRTLNQRGQK